MAYFPSKDWLESLNNKLNTDEQYAQIARNWEGDMIFAIEPDETLVEEVKFYLDLYHGKCRQAFMIDDEHANQKAVFTLRGPYGNYARLLEGKLEPMTALLTRKLGVQGNMAVLMRNIPTVLDFVRCCREVTDNLTKPALS